MPRPPAFACVLVSARRHQILGISGWQCPGQISVAIPLSSGGPLAYPLPAPGPEESGDGMWLPGSFMVFCASSNFYFGTHKGQSQPLPAEKAVCEPGAAGIRTLLGPTNQEA